MSHMSHIILLLSIIAIASVLYLQSRQGQQRQEGYAPEYQDMLSVPTSAYSTLSDNDISYQKRYYLEFNDRFFHDALLDALSTQKIDTSGWKDTVKYDASSIKFKVNAFIEGVLNHELQGTDPNLFSVVKNDILSMINSPDKKEYVVRSKVLIHRNQKLYGVLLEIKTLHNADTSRTSLIEYNLNGFVFEDKIHDNIMPSNYDETNELEFEDINNAKIIKDETYEKTVACKYYKDLKKYRGLDVDNSDPKFKCT